ncbi:hypothetical protein MMC10_007106 [Thelotrema lepadinum]|nr:hypothetical protein [Thelotrema lepadinum]
MSTSETPASSSSKLGDRISSIKDRVLGGSKHSEQSGDNVTTDSSPAPAKDGEAGISDTKGADQQNPLYDQDINGSSKAPAPEPETQQTDSTAANGTSNTPGASVPAPTEEKPTSVENDPASQPTPNGNSDTAGQAAAKATSEDTTSTNDQTKLPEHTVTNGKEASATTSAINGATTETSNGEFHLSEDASRLKFAYWVPNVSGGLVISKIPQRTNWDLPSNIKYARTAEKVGFEYALSQIRFMAGYGAENQHEPVSFSQALLHSTEKIKLIAALLPGPWNPAVAAKQIASIDNYTNGRVAVNVVSGWFKLEFTSIGQWWLDHAERYRRSREFISCLKGIWSIQTQDNFTFKGDFYQFHDYTLKPKPLSWEGRPYPEIFQGGNSGDARDNAATVSDYYFMNGNTLEGFQTQIADVKERAKKAGREGQVKFALNGFVISRPTEQEAVRVLQEIQGKADKDAVEAFREQVQNAGASTSNKTGMWANSKFEDLVQYNDGFKTKLIGTPAQIADRILLLKSLGVDILLTAFLHYDEEIEAFGRDVIPLIRKAEKDGRGVDSEDEIRRTGDVYRARNQPEGEAATKV